VDRADQPRAWRRAVSELERANSQRMLYRQRPCAYDARLGGPCTQQLRGAEFRLRADARRMDANPRQDRIPRAYQWRYALFGAARRSRQCYCAIVQSLDSAAVVAARSRLADRLGYRGFRPAQRTPTGRDVAAG